MIIVIIETVSSHLLQEILNSEEFRSQLGMLLPSIEALTSRVGQYRKSPIEPLLVGLSTDAHEVLGSSEPTGMAIPASSEKGHPYSQR
jgi:hypothetical protein